MKIVTLSGLTCSGKSHLEQQMLADGAFCELIGITTRMPRWGEQNGKDYHFVTPAQAQSMIENRELVEWNDFGGHIYGTPKSSLDAALATGKTPVIILEPNGVVQMARYCRACGIGHLPVWISIDPDLQAARFMEREASHKETVRRLGMMLGVEQGWRKQMPLNSVSIDAVALQDSNVGPSLIKRLLD